MFKKLSKVTMLIVLVLASFCCVASSHKKEKIFFENPSISMLNRQIKDISSNVKLNTDINKDKIIIFLSEAFKANPNLSKDVISRFSSYNSSAQELLYSGLVSSQAELPTQFKEKHKNIKIRVAKDVAAMKFIEPYSGNEDLVKNMDIMDLHWSAYYATGNPLYLKKIVRFVSNHSSIAKELSSELTNREYLNDLVAASGQKEKISNDDLLKAAKENKVLYQMLGHNTAMWSIRSNAAMYSAVQKAVNELLKADPSLSLY